MAGIGVRVGRGLGTVVMAGVLVFAVPIQAQALAPSPVALGELIIGAVKSAAPGVAKVAVTLPGRANPIGTALTIGQIMYMTRDSWMPWVENEFGVGGGTQAAQPSPTVKFTWSVSVVRDVATLTVQAASTTWVSVHVTGTCKNLTTGALSALPAPPDGTQLFGLLQQNTTKSKAVGPCAPGSQIYVFDATGGEGGNFAPALHWGASFNPQTEATYQTEIDCRLPNGTLATLTRTTVSPQGGGLAVGSCEAAFPGSHGIALRLDAGRTGEPLERQWEQTFDETSELYPNCVGAGNSACTYVLSYEGVACLIGQIECINWTLKAETQPLRAKYGCSYGAYVLDLTGCNILERAYEPNGTYMTPANTDGNPTTASPPYPDWVPNPADVPDPNKTPGPAVGGFPTESVIPGIKTHGVPTPNPMPDPVPGASPNESTDCWPTGIVAWNPAEWVLRPVKCAFVWAFIPKATSMRTDLIQAQLDRAGIAPSVAALSMAVGTLGGSGAGCTGPSINFDIPPVHQVVTPFAACVAPMSTVAGYAYAFICVLVPISGAYAIINGILAGFGLHTTNPGTYRQG